MRRSAQGGDRGLTPFLTSNQGAHAISAISLVSRLLFSCIAQAGSIVTGCSFLIKYTQLVKIEPEDGAGRVGLRSSNSIF